MARNGLPQNVLLNVNVADALFVGLVGVVRMTVSGEVESTTQVKLAGVASVLPAASIARAWKVWLPSERPV